MNISDTVPDSRQPSSAVVPEPPVKKTSDTRLFFVLLSLSGIFFLAHAAFLPTTFADLDAINFALGVRDFDVSRHQPHPPGYPVFIAAGKASTAILAAAGVAAPEVRGLSILSAIGGALHAAARPSSAAGR